MTPADQQDKRRVIVEAARGLSNQGKFYVYEGGWNMNSQVYLGSLENAMSIKRAYLATGEYVDESPDPAHRESEEGDSWLESVIEIN